MKITRRKYDVGEYGLVLSDVSEYDLVEILKHLPVDCDARSEIEKTLIEYITPEYLIKRGYKFNIEKSESGRLLYDSTVVHALRKDYLWRKHEIELKAYTDM